MSASAAAAKAAGRGARGAGAWPVSGSLSDGAADDEPQQPQQPQQHPSEAQCVSRSLPSGFSCGRGAAAPAASAVTGGLGGVGAAAGEATSLSGGGDGGVVRVVVVGSLEPPPAPRFSPTSPQTMPPRIALPPPSPECRSDFTGSPLSSSGVSMIESRSPPTPHYVQVGFHVGSPTTHNAEMTIHAVLARDPAALVFEAQQRRHRMKLHQQRDAHATYGGGSGGGGYHHHYHAGKARNLARSR